MDLRKEKLTVLLRLRCGHEGGGQQSVILQVCGQAHLWALLLTRFQVN